MPRHGFWILSTRQIVILQELEELLETAVLAKPRCKARAIHHQRIAKVLWPVSLFHQLSINKSHAMKPSLLFTDPRRAFMISTL